MLLYRTNKYTHIYILFVYLPGILMLFRGGCFVRVKKNHPWPSFIIVRTCHMESNSKKDVSNCNGCTVYIVFFYR